MSNLDAIVIGGGIAGLTAAVALAREGKRVLVFEAEPILGGRAASVSDPVTGGALDLGPHILFSEYPNFRALLRILGTEQKVVWQPREMTRVFVRGRRYDYQPDRRLPPPLHFLPLLFSDKTSNLRQKLSNLGALRELLLFAEDQVPVLDRLSGEEWLARAGVDPLVRGLFWAFASFAIMNVPLAECSAAALARFFHRLASRNDYTIGFAAGGLGQLFAPPAAALIGSHGGEVVTGAAVKKIVFENGGFAGVVDQRGEFCRAATGICTAPLHLLPDLLAGAPEIAARFSALKNFLPSPYKSVYVWFDEKITDLPFWARWGDHDFLNLDFYDLSNIDPALQGGPSLIASNIIYCHRAMELTHGEIVNRTVAEIAAVAPRARTAKLLRWRVHDIPMAIHCPFPGTESLRPEIATGISGFFLAGDFSRTALPASMESAARAGWLAAEAVLAHLGTDKRLALDQRPPEGLFKLFQKDGTISNFLRHPPRKAFAKDSGCIV